MTPTRPPRVGDLLPAIGVILWATLPWHQRLWLRLRGRKAETQRRLGAAFCEVSPLLRGAPPAGIRSARMP